MSFDGTEGGSISLATAAVWTANYRNQISEGDTIAHFFGKDIIHDILNQSGCVGIRMYYGLDGHGKKQLILVGVDANEDDLDTGIIADNSYPCPAYCSKSNDLNS